MTTAQQTVRAHLERARSEPALADCRALGEAPRRTGAPADDARAHAEAVGRATRAIAGRRRDDALRPTRHLSLAPWINDPNGPIQVDGKYHLFAQVNPYAPSWGTIHWAHAESRDLVRWTEAPVALAPDMELGEKHCFSGGTHKLRDKAETALIYTSIGFQRPAPDGAVQCIAYSRDPDLRIWEKRTSTPIITDTLNDGSKVYEARDPYIFEHGGETYCIIGGSLRPNLGGRSVVPIYRAESAQLDSWKSLGILYEHPDSERVPNLECPNLFPLGDRWLLTFSPHGQTRYIVGDFDARTHRFHAEREGALDLSGRDDYYAPTSMKDDQGRRIVFGWVGGFEKRADWKKEGERGWNGCLAFPRELSMRPDGHVGVAPVAELATLREHCLASIRDLDLEGSRRLEAVSGDGLEIRATFESGQASSVGLALRASDEHKAELRFDGQTLEVAGVRAPFSLLPSERTLDLHAFFDRSLLEIFVNGRAAMTRVLDVPSTRLSLEVFAEGGRARLGALDVWSLAKLD